MVHYGYDRQLFAPTSVPTRRYAFDCLLIIIYWKGVVVNDNH